MNSTLRWLAAGCCCLAACSTQSPQESPEPTIEQAASALIWDDPRGGVEGFWWLPPIVPRPAIRGEFSPDLNPVVRIDQVSATAAVIRNIGTWTKTTGPGTERIRARLKNDPPESDDDDPIGFFILKWKTKDFDLSAQANYRINVLVKGVVIGFADVDVVTSRKEYKKVDATQYVPLEENDVIRIKFRIIDDAVPPDADGDGLADSIDNCPGHANASQLDTDHDGQGDACECAAVTCAAQDSCHLAGVCNPTNGTCSNPAKADGASCSDGDACTTVDTCSAGSCRGASPVTCTASDQCHVAGTCDPGTGTCSNPAKADGAACDDGNACTQADSCQAGTCAGANPIVCGASDQCHVAGTCNPLTGACSNPAAPNGVACDDGSACTQSDSCQAGACIGANPVVCAASDQCHVAGVCDPSSGACSNPAKANGASCNDGNACTRSDSCQAGVCTGANPVACAASDQCHVAGLCDPSTGACSNPAAADGVACNDGDACTQSDSCVAGACNGTNPVTCVALDQCHDAGACDPTSGACSNPAKESGAPCNDGDACSTVDVCSLGTCVGTTPVVCEALDACHVSGTCDSLTGLCSNPNADDGATCSDGDACTADACFQGECAGAPIVCDDGDACSDDACDSVAGCFAIDHDADDDLTCDAEDNCALASNADQGDIDGDGIGDACDPCPSDAANDRDGDGVCGDVDNCALLSNANQADTDGDGVGDVCDNCALANADQEDGNGDGIGTECDADDDGTRDDTDNCPRHVNPDQADEDGDGLGDECDPCRHDPTGAESDLDGDWIGDSCDPDLDNDGLRNDVDPEPASAAQAVATLSAFGGDVRVTDEHSPAFGVGVTFPAGSVPSGTVVEIRSLDPLFGPGMDVLGVVSKPVTIALSTDAPLAVPATLTLPFDLVAARGIPVGDLVALRYEDGSNVPEVVRPTSVDLVNGTIAVSTMHFSTWIVARSGGRAFVPLLTDELLAASYTVPLSQYNFTLTGVVPYSESDKRKVLLQIKQPDQPERSQFATIDSCDAAAGTCRWSSPLSFNGNIRLDVVVTFTHNHCEQCPRKQIVEDENSQLMRSILSDDGYDDFTSGMETGLNVFLCDGAAKVFAFFGDKGVCKDWPLAIERYAFSYSSCRDRDRDGYVSCPSAAEYESWGLQMPPVDADLPNDCNDDSVAFNPGVAEVCDGIDQNCNGVKDEGFPDTDRDGVADCVDPDDDGDGRPDVSDNCRLIGNPSQSDDDGDGVGNACDNCVNVPNPGQENTRGGWAGDVCDDADGDGHKALPAGFDCDDTRADVRPGAVEVCDGKDNDCDGQVDEGFPNTDGDQLADCVDPDIDNDGWPNNNDDCPKNANPIQGIDRDTDGVPDACDNCPSVSNGPMTTYNRSVLAVYYLPLSQRDVDYDGIGDACDDGDGDGSVALYDCWDANPTVYPGAPEICDGLDNDCNGLTRDGVADARVGLACSNPNCASAGVTACAGEAGIACKINGFTCVDLDGDGYDTCPPEACNALDSNPTDCRDDGKRFSGLLAIETQSRDIHPGVAELCNEVDDDCDGLIDEGFPGDIDHDGVPDCGDYDRDGDGFMNWADFCPDTPSATNLDSDRDGLGDACDNCPRMRNPGQENSNATPTGDVCEDGDGDGVLAWNDCDDTNAARYWGATEICDGIDNDCRPETFDGQGVGVGSRCHENGSDGVCEESKWACQGNARVCVTTPKPAGTVCRDSLGACDSPNTCDGVHDTCPSGLLPQGTVCREAAGECDRAEVCNGNTATCPNDQKRTGDLCRESGGLCDLPEFCSGSSNSCPADAKRPSGQTCRSSSGSCDLADVCDGTTNDCADNIKAVGTVCQAASGVCDVADVCDGTTKDCAPRYQDATVQCRGTAGDCDVAEFCTGFTTTCPVDSKKPLNTICRGTAGDCDVAEVCNGSSVLCPNDTKKAANTVCRAAQAGGCDVAEVCNGSNAACPNDAVVTGGTICRAAVAGGCDIAEACTGSSPLCPADATVAPGTVCRAATGGGCDVAETCTGANTCPADGYQPLNTVCRGASDLCDVGEVCTGASATCPTDAVRPSGFSCRADSGNGCDVADTCNGSAKTCTNILRPNGFSCRGSAGVCDVGETCTGSSDTCPADGFQASSTVCRGASTTCDVAEYCTGSSAVCPATDAVAPSTTVCRPAAAGTNCDVAEFCTGGSKTCPTDAFAPSTTLCRAIAGGSTCDVAEYCTGAQAACPNDGFLPSSTVCRGSNGACDPAETCSGSGAFCPSDTLSASGTVCRAANGVCDTAETCTGSAAACPVDAFVPSTTVCRAASTNCDVAEYCTGSSGACPAVDAVAPNTTVCRAANGVCDAAETCTGSSKTCPTDAFLGTSTVCRPIAGGSTCDVAEVCSGSAATCPADAFAPNTATCRAVNGACDVAEKCSGSGAFCPADAFVASGAVCRTANGSCDVAEACTGASGACPTDGFASTSTVCRNATSACDAVERCTGSASTCPADGNVANGTSCSDGNACNGAETCQAGTCTVGSGPACDDGNACTADYCEAATGCGHSPSCSGDCLDTGWPPLCPDRTYYVCLLHRWRFNEATGSTTANVLGTNAGTIGAAVGRTDGLDGLAFQFPGGTNTGSVVNVGAAPGQFGTRNFVVSFWIKTAGVAELSEVMGNRTTSGHGNFFQVRLAANGEIYATLDQDAAGTNFVEVNGGNVASNTWRHVAVVRNGYNLDLFIDGNSIDHGNSVTDTNITTSQPFLIGASGVSGMPRFTGALEDVRIYDGEIKYDEIGGLSWVNCP